MVILGGWVFMSEVPLAERFPKHSEAGASARAAGLDGAAGQTGACRQTRPLEAEGHPARPEALRVGVRRSKRCVLVCASCVGHRPLEAEGGPCPKSCVFYLTQRDFEVVLHKTFMEQLVKQEPAAKRDLWKQKVARPNPKRCVLVCVSRSGACWCAQVVLDTDLWKQKIARPSSSRVYYSRA